MYRYDGERGCGLGVGNVRGVFMHQRAVRYVAALAAVGAGGVPACALQVGFTFGFEPAGSCEDVWTCFIESLLEMVVKKIEGLAK